jgi:ribonuclease HII
VPSGRWEATLRRKGRVRIAGTDEVGRGCLAGPVVAAAVILRPGIAIPGLRDSKLLSPLQRRRLVRPILEACEAFGLGAVAPVGIDRWNIRRASFRAMRIAIARLGAAPDHVLVDGFRIPGLRLGQTAIIGGDRRCRSIAAASVLAKVARDRRMDRYHQLHPAFGFDRNRGYPTPDHIEALERLGVTPIHRRSFAPVRRVLEGPARLPF